MKFLSKKVQCPKNIYIRAVAAQMWIIFQLNILLRIICIIQTGYVNLHFYFLVILYKNLIQERYLQLRSSTKYYPNANNTGPIKIFCENMTMTTCVFLSDHNISLIRFCFRQWKWRRTLMSEVCRNEFDTNNRVLWKKRVFSEELIQIHPSFPL